MGTTSKLGLHVETWLREGEMMRRIASKERMTVEAFEEQRKLDVEYVILRRVRGTYSDGKGASRPAYERMG